MTGPYTGTVHRFVVDQFSFPTTTTEARAVGDDLDGDNTVDNQLGLTIATLNSFGNVTTHADDMVASGAIASVLEIVADDLENDPTVAVRYFGREGDPAIEVGGTIVNGVFRSNRTRTTQVPGKATLRLPVFADADPSVVVLDGMEIDLSPDQTGYVVHIRGGVGEDALAASARGVVQMIEANPAGHPSAIRIFDANVDGKVSMEEATTTDVLEAMVAPDVTLFVDGDDVQRVSLGFAVHVIPCSAGICALATPAHTCFDRILDGDETAIDCGGSCMPCAGEATCRVPADCQSQACSGVCAAPSCTDGIASGFETDVDCGWNCDGCNYGQRCETNDDCKSERCGEHGLCW